MIQRSSARVAEVVFLAAYALLLPLSPWLFAALSGDAAYVRHYGRSLRHSLRMFRTMAASGVVARNLRRSWSSNSAAPLSIEGECTHCGACCIHRQCVFLRFDALQRSQCSIYGNWFWRRTSCGRYPIDAADLEVYACPSYRVIPIRAD